MDKAETQKYVQELQKYIKILQKENDELKSKNSELHCEIQTINAVPDSVYAKELEKELKRTETKINQIDDILNELFGVEHDVVKTPEEFKKILKEKVENYKTAFDIIPTEPIKVANMLINAEEEYETNGIARMLGAGEKRKYNIFSVSDLRQIAEHLIVYCNHNSEENS